MGLGAGMVYYKRCISSVIFFFIITYRLHYYYFLQNGSLLTRLSTQNAYVGKKTKIPPFFGHQCYDD